MKSMNQKIFQGEKTKDALIKHARKSFAKKGYSKTCFNEIAITKGLTKGALYHHFKNKAELFSGVFEACAYEVSQKVFYEADKYESPSEGIIAGCVEYIDCVTSNSLRRIMLEDSISVLGWPAWKEIDDRTSEKGLLQAVKEAQQKKEMRRDVSSRALTRFISGGTNELALWAANQTKKQNSIDEAKIVLKTVIEGLKQEEKNYDK